MPNTANDIVIKKENFSVDELLPPPLPKRLKTVTDSEPITLDLNKLLANEFAVFTKTLKYHWNVKGPRFKSIHEFFEDQYKQLLAVTDDVAERVRKLDGAAIGTIEEFQKKSSIPENPGKVPDTQAMLDQLAQDHQEICYQITSILGRDRGRSLDRGTEDFLTGLLRKHEDMIWRLKSHGN